MSETDSVAPEHHPEDSRHDNETLPAVRTVAALREAVESRDCRKLESLLGTLSAEDRDACITARHSYMSVLHRVAHLNYPDIAGLLLENVTDKDEYIATMDVVGDTALHTAAFSGNFEMVDFLVKNVTAKNEYVTTKSKGQGKTALHFAAKLDSPRIAALLIKNATDKDGYVNTPDYNHLTALHIAIDDNKLEIVTLLVNNIKDKDTCFTAHDGRRDPALHLAVHRDAADIVHLLINNVTEKTRVLNAANYHQQTPLHIAAFCNAVNVIFPLLENGSDARLRDSHGLTAWDVAVRRKSWEFISAVILAEERWLIKPNLPVIYIHDNDMVQKILGGCAATPECPNVRSGRISMRQLGLSTSEDVRLAKALGSLLRQLRREFHENDEAPPDRRSREPSCVVQTLDMAGPKSGKPNEFISLVMPFIHVDHVTLNRRDSGYVGRTKPLRYCISDHHTILERHMPLTLDEYCSPALSTDILKFRNGDQVLGRHQRSMQDQNNRARMPKNEEKEAPTLLGDLRILMSQYARKLARRINPGNRDLDNQQSKKTMVVDPPPMDTVFVMQAWIWRIGDYVITTSPPNNDDELRIQLLEEDQCLTIALILGGLVDRFDNRREKEASLLKTYENALSVISEGVSQYVGSVLMEDIDLEQEKDFIHQISDLREELSMIKSVLAEQEDVWKEFIGFIWPTQGPDQQPSRWRDTGDRTTADSEQLAKGGIEDKWSREHWRVQSKFNKYRRRISKLEQDAERVERNISTQLDLKQKHATMKEAHSTAIMSAAVFGFTIITIIFAPLSFMAALFALPIDMFNQGKRGNEADGAYSSNYIGKWSATAEIVSIVVTLVAMWAALQFADLHIWGKKGMREWVRQRANNVYIAERRSHRDTDPV